jgi:hypothetical protein
VDKQIGTYIEDNVGVAIVEFPIILFGPGLHLELLEKKNKQSV